MSELGKRIRKARESAGLTQESIARSMGLTRAALAHWESGRSNPTYANLTVFAGLVGLSVAEIAGGDVPPPPAQAEAPHEGRVHYAFSADIDPSRKRAVTVEGEILRSHDTTRRRAHFFWAAVGYECIPEMAECFERPLLGNTVRADYFDGRNLVEYGNLSFTALGRLMLIRQMMGRATRAYMIVAEHPATQPFTQEQLRMATAADVELRAFDTPQAAAEFLSRLYLVANPPQPPA